MNDIYDLAIEAALSAGVKILEIYNSSDFEVTEKSDNSPLTKADRDAHEIIVGGLKGSPYPVLSEEGKDIPFSVRSKWTRFWLVDPLDGTKEFIKKNDEFTLNIALIDNGIPIFGVVFAPVLNELYIGIVGQGSWLLKEPDLNNIKSFRKQAKSLPIDDKTKQYTVVASRSHLNADTEKYINEVRNKHSSVNLISVGSSLKLCLVAFGTADEYPRLGPTMEWDIAAAHAVVKASGKNVYKFAAISEDEYEELTYNKENLLNPYFIAI